MDPELQDFPNLKYDVVWTLGYPKTSQFAFHSAKDLYRWLTRNGKVEAIQTLNQMRPVVYTQYIGEPEGGQTTGPAYKASRYAWNESIQSYTFSDPNKALAYLEANQDKLYYGIKDASQKKSKSMGDLRKKLIRLAHAKPTLRPDLLPIIKKADSRLLEVLGLNPTDKDALENLYKEFERGRVSGGQINRALPKVWQRWGVNWTIRAFQSNPLDDNLWKKIERLGKDRLIDHETMDHLYSQRSGAEQEQYERDIHDDSGADDYFDELKAENDKAINNWLQQLPRLAKRYVPELANMRLKLAASEIDIDGADGSYTAKVVVLSPELVGMVKDAQRNNGNLSDRDLDRRFEKFVEAAARLLQEDVEADDESVFWLEEMKILGRNTSSFEIFVSLWSYDGPDY